MATDARKPRVSATASAPAQNASDDKNRIQSYQRMVDVLRSFSSSARRLSVAQIAAGTGLPRPTVHRILAALRDIGFIEQDAKGGGYMLGIGLYELGSLSLANMDLHREAHAFIDQLARLSGRSVHLRVFNGQSVVVIEREDLDEQRKSLASHVEIAPIHCTGVGKAVGAWLPHELIRKIAAPGLQAYTVNTITGLSELEREYARIRKRGFAFDNEELQLWIRCVAAPIRNASGRVFAAISVSGPPERMGPQRQAQLGPLVADTAAALSRHLGFDSRHPAGTGDKHTR